MNSSRIVWQWVSVYWSYPYGVTVEGKRHLELGHLVDSCDYRDPPPSSLPPSLCPSLISISISFSLSFLRQGLLYSRLAVGSQYSQDDYELLILLPPLPKCWDYRFIPRPLPYAMLGKHSSNWVIPQPLIAEISSNYFKLILLKYTEQINRNNIFLEGRALKTSFLTCTTTPPGHCPWPYSTRKAEAGLGAL